MSSVLLALLDRPRFLGWLRSSVPGLEPRDYEADRLIPRRDGFDLRIRVQARDGTWSATAFRIVRALPNGLPAFALGSWFLVYHEPVEDSHILVAKALKANTSRHVGRMLGADIVDSSLYSYTPFRRAVIRYVASDAKVYYGKLYRAGQSQRALETTNQLRDAGLSDCLAEPAVHLVDLEMIIWREAAGSVLGREYPRDEYRRGLHRAGIALRRLHAANVREILDRPATELRTLTDEMRVTRKYLDRVATLLDGQPSELERCYADLDRSCVGADEYDPMTLHGDFHDNQVVLSDGGAVILDLDQIVRGDPAVDIGNFLAHIDFRIAYETADDDPLPYAEAFAKGYGDFDDARLRRRIAVGHAVSLLRNCCLYVLVPSRLQALTAACRRVVGIVTEE